MRKAALIIAMALLWGGTGPAQAEPAGNPKRIERQLPAPSARGVTAISIGYVENRAASGGRVALCANLAATRALNAKTMGASFAAQDRILDLTFVLCMAGPQTVD